MLREKILLLVRQRSRKPKRRIFTMKKIMALLLACVMLIALAACGITPEHTHPSTKPDELYYPCTDPEWTT